MSSFSLTYTTTSGLVLTCSDCGTVTEYPAPDGSPGSTVALAEVNDDALGHEYLEHS